MMVKDEDAKVIIKVLINCLRFFDRKLDGLLYLCCRISKKHSTIII